MIFKPTNDFQIFPKGTEMEELIKKFDWNSTPLGNKASWKPSLKLTLSMMLNSKFPMFLWWGDELIQFYNDAYRPSLGETGKHPTALGQKAKECWPEIWDTISPMINHVLTTQQPVWSEDQNIPIERNGRMEDVYWTFSYSAITDENEKVEGILVICTETTEKVKSRLLLEESESRFRTMADNIPNLAWMADDQGYIFWYNEQWYKYTGTIPSQMEGWGWQSVHHPDWLQTVMDKWIASIAHGKPFEMVFPLKGADGKYRQFLTRVLPVKKDGKLYQWFGTNTDITDQIAFEAAFKESEERFKNMAEHTDILIAITNELGHATYFNTAWLRLTNLKHKELHNVDWDTIIIEEDYEKFIKKYDKALKNSLNWDAEFRTIDSEGNYKWILATGVARFTQNFFSGYIISGIDITDRKLIQEKVKLSEQDLQKMVLDAPIGICILDAESLMIEIVNEQFIDVVGQSREALLSKNYWGNFKETSETYESQLYQTISSGKAFEVKEAEVELFKNGVLQKVYLSFIYAPLFDTHEKVRKVAVWLIDNTPQVRARKKVEASEANLRNTILKAPVAMCIFKEPKYVVEIANERMYELWGKTGNEILNKPIFEVIPEFKNHGIEQILYNVFTTGEAFATNDIPIIFQKNGNQEIIYINYIIEAYNSLDGSIEGLILAAVDVTPQVQARKVLESDYQRFLTLSNAIPQIVWTAKPDGNLDYFNIQWMKYSGLSYEESKDAGWATTVHLDDIESLSEAWKASLISGNPYQVEARVKKHDGEFRWFLIRALPHFEVQKIVQWVGTCTDIQDQKNSEKELYELTDQLGALNEELTVSNEELSVSNHHLTLINADLDNFIYTASHDLKAPISNIEGLMSALMETLPPPIVKDEEVVMLTDLMKASISRFKKTILQLTDITQLQKEFNFESKEVVVADVLSEVLLDLQMVIQQNKATIHVHLDNDIKVYFSFKNLRSILYNLLSNAIKYRHAERNPEIHISYADTLGFQTLSVSDNGLGIDKSNNSKLFSMFVRLHDHVEGSGIGLYIIKKMLENAGGKIEVESEVNKGSTFKVYFKHKRTS